VTAERPDLASHVRWTWNGGRRIHISDLPRPGEVVVTGRGKRSHRLMSCAALWSGRAKAISKGWASGGFFAVSNELADRFVEHCTLCWSDPGPGAEHAPSSNAVDVASDDQDDQEGGDRS
jgi:hypothetical protein